MAYNFIAAAIAGVMPAARATGLFVSTVTFQAPDGVLGASGAPSGDYADVAGLVDIPCMDAPDITSEVMVGAKKYRTMSETTEEAARHVLLNDFFPAVAQYWRYGLRAIIDGKQYDVCGAESDSQSTQTRCELKLITIGAIATP